MPYTRREDRLAAQRRANKRHRDKKRQRLNEVKLARGCARCGYSEHPAALQFHHRDEKFRTVARMAGQRWELIEEEIAKCDVLCANCHAIHHYSD